jgi:hypothetical protein
MSKWSNDALAQWKSLIKQALEYSNARAVIIPVIEYDGMEKDVSDGDGRFRAPLFIERQFNDETITAEIIGKTAALSSGYDVALGTHVTILHMDQEPKLRRLDAHDVEPGHVFHPSDPLLERYVALRTSSSYHLYPRRDPFGDGEGKSVADTKWAKGFLRITEGKGPIALTSEVSRG